MQSVSEITIFGLKMIMKSALEKIFFKSLTFLFKPKCISSCRFHFEGKKYGRVTAIKCVIEIFKNSCKIECHKVKMNFTGGNGFIIFCWNRHLCSKNIFSLKNSKHNYSFSLYQNPKYLCFTLDIKLLVFMRSKLEELHL